MNQKSLDKKKTNIMGKGGSQRPNKGESYSHLSDTADAHLLDWEKEFDKKIDEWVGFYDKEHKIIRVKTPEIKDFITQLLSTQRQQLIEEILGLEGMKKEKIWKRYYSNSGVEIILVKERNQLRSQIKAEIKSLDKK